MVICRLVVTALGCQSIRFKGVAVGIELWGVFGMGIDGESASPRETGDTVLHLMYMNIEHLRI